MKKILLILFLCFIITIQGMAATYTSQYPTGHTDDYVKSTTKYSTTYWAYYATDPALSLTGDWDNVTWLSDGNTNQRFHIDLGSAKIIKRIYYENCHDSGGSTTYGTQNFTFQGSNTASGTFDDLVYTNDEGWTNLTTSQATFDEHTGADQADPKYITVTNTTAYRYYAIKCADNHGGDWFLGFRHIVLQTEDPTFALEKFNAVVCTKWNGLEIVEWNATSIP